MELAESSCSHLFRHASEITRETKGGYLMGRIRVPEHLARGGGGSQQFRHTRSTCWRNLSRSLVSARIGCSTLGGSDREHPKE